MDLLNYLLKTVDYTRREPLPEGFENRVLDKWFNKQQPAKKKNFTAFIYAAAACLIAFSCINILLLQVLNQPEEALSLDANTNIQISSEAEFAEAYGLAGTTSYYTLNK